MDARDDPEGFLFDFDKYPPEKLNETRRKAMNVTEEYNRHVVARAPLVNSDLLSIQAIPRSV
jgi:hypothetical protein